MRFIIPIILVGAAMLHSAVAKTVFAHFMTQNSYSYAVADWTNEFQIAQGIGIDGFALNTATNSYELDRMNDAFSAAEPLGFKLFISFDMSYGWTSDAIVSAVTAHAGSSAYFQWNGKPLVSTYSGEGNGDSFWAGVKSTLAGQGHTVSFAPAFTSYRDPSNADSLLSTFPSIDGFFNWWSWPADTNSNLTTDTDVAYQKAIKSRTGSYIMSVSPWQFKDIDPSNAQDNWVEYSDTLWKYRWEQAAQQVIPDIVEIVTWNDYPESHYISDIFPKSDLGDLAPQYVTGFTHAAWRDVAKYYISLYKNGKAPAITTNEVVYWYRTHPKGVTCSGGTKPRNSDFPADEVFALAILKDNATFSIDVGSTHVTFDVPAGVTLRSAPFSSDASQTPVIKILQSGTAIASGTGAKAITQNCTYYNFNPIVGSVSA
ncbi:glycoside hydrolase family 71 protein [Plicaturopsis crispa FD-325 SS-3]|nr:glycoside hydrolase family 71 protein [Plicaturopsis crispa FD-325 SS-3]